LEVASKYLHSTHSLLETYSKSLCLESNIVQKSFTRRATSAALTTIRKRSKVTNLKLFGTCCSPFAQRVWIALETLSIPYQYIEVDPYKKPVVLLEIDLVGHVPTLRHGAWGCSDSAVLVEYLDDLTGPTEGLLPKDLKKKARCKQWATYIDRHIVPAFYALLASPLPSPSPAHAKLESCISTLVEAAASDGPFFMNDRLGFVDVMFAPWIVRRSRLLKKFRDWPDPEQGSRWERWMQAADERIRATCNGEEVYEDAVARWTQGKTGQGDLGLGWGELEGPRWRI
jgi:glutathione S-transferase